MASRSNRKKGGRVGMVVSGNPDVLEETKDMDNEGGKKRGGKVKKAKGGLVMGGKTASRRFDRPGRKSGGAVGANRSPLSTAHGTSSTSGCSSPTDTYGGTPK